MWRGWWAGWTGCRWRSSWPRRGPRRWACPSCWAGWMTGWRCRRAGTGWRPGGTGRWPLPRTGATSCWPRTSGGCSAACRCSRRRSPWRRPKRSRVRRRRAVLRLVECSLLVPPRPGPDGRSRYAMLETLRGYGAGLLAGAGEQDRAQAALARYAVRVAEAADAGLETIAGELAAARWLDAEDATMAHVLAWAVEHDLDTAVRLVTALSLWWVLRGRLAGQQPLLRELAGRAGPGSEGWCTAQFWLAWTAFDAADLPGALQLCSAVIDVIGDREPSRLLVDCLDLQSAVSSNLGRVQEAAAISRRALAMARELGYPFGQAFALEWPGHRRLVRRRPGRCRPAGPAGRADPGHPRHGRPGVRLPAGRGADRGRRPGRRRTGLRRHAGPGPGRRRPVCPGQAAADHGRPGPAGRPHRRRRRAPARGSPDRAADRFRGSRC